MIVDFFSCMCTNMVKEILCLREELTEYFTVGLSY